MMHAATRPRVALYVDGENISPSHASALLEVAGRRGRLQSARAYGDAAQLPGWQKAPGYSLVHVAPGPCATDLRLSIDMVRAAAEDRWDIACLASSDSDFAPLALELRDIGKEVIGLGEAKASKRLRAACTEFLEIAEAEALSPVDASIHALLVTDPKGQLSVQALGIRLPRERGIRLANVKEASWTSYVSARPDLYRVDKSGPIPMVRAR
ncbi:NYN domain-containing protein [Pseudoroseicyclus sp. H15]